MKTLTLSDQDEVLLKNVLSIANSSPNVNDDESQYCIKLARELEAEQQKIEVTQISESVYDFGFKCFYAGGGQDTLEDSEAQYKRFLNDNAVFLHLESNAKPIADAEGGEDGK